jgi:hypothetical protein
MHFKTYLQRMRGTVVSALGVTILLGTPLIAQADQGKWWKPKEGDQKVERRDRSWQGARDRGNRGDRGSWQGARDQRQQRGDRGSWQGARDQRQQRDRGSWQGAPDQRQQRDRGTWSGRQGGGDRTGWNGRPGTVDRGTAGRTWRDRSGTDRGTVQRGTRERVRVGDRTTVRNRTGNNRGFIGGVTYRDRGISARGSWGGHSTWQGLPVRRDFYTIRDPRYGGGYFRARRIYCAPRYYGRFVYVRPIRFFIAANAFFGPIGVRARIVRPHYLYGCNFCEDRFDTYGAYCQHVEHCGLRPSGFEISVSDWDDQYDAQWDGPYQTDDEYYDNDQSDNQSDDYDSEDEGYYDN